MPTNLLLIEGGGCGTHVVRDALIASQDPGYHVECVCTCAEALARLVPEAGRPTETPVAAPTIAAIVVDLYLSDSQGIATFDRLYAAVPQIPILILTTAKDEDVAKLAVERGAEDYFFTDRPDAFPIPKALAGLVDRAANTEALFEEKERALITLNSIGDAVISTDLGGRVTYLNAVAERLSGWRRADAVGHRFEEVFRIVDANTREVVANPMAIAARENQTVELTANSVLIRRDGVESDIEDSAAPIHDRRGQVTGSVMVFHDVSSARALARRMAYLAQHDSLTNLPNRALLQDRLAQAMAAAHRHGKKLALLFLDVDRFKQINDSLGHTTGDRLLQSIARRLSHCVRASDTVSRQGGDEFVVVFCDAAHAHDAAICAEKLLRAVSESHQIDQHEIHVTASIGVVLYPDDGLEAETLLKNADFAMYQAKEGGRNNYQFYQSDLHSNATERQSLETNLRHAVKRHEFELHYQPNVNLVTGAVVGVEALIRWRHPDRGLVGPGAFISIAEESGLIVPIGRWVLHEACRQAAFWEDAGLAAVRLAINVSAVELRDPGFVAGVREILAETGFDPRRLVLELTETFLMQHSRATSTVLLAIKDLGIRLALDDFGTGYSSLSYMRRFPIDILKIDRSFVNDLSTDADDASIVSAVINMGKSLHMTVVAEGIETLDQVSFLAHHGCPEGQGYFFSVPLGPAEFGSYLRDHMGPAAQPRDDRPVARHTLNVTSL